MARTVNVQKTYVRDIEVEVSDEQYAQLADLDHPDHDKAFDFVISAAIDKEGESARKSELPLEWMFTNVTGEADEEMGDVG